MNDDKYEIIEPLGKGAFGEVYKGRRRDGTGQPCAVKYISTFRTKRELNDVRNEILIMKKLDHPNIIRLIDSYDISGYIVVVTECAAQELYKSLTKVGHFPESKVYTISCQLCSAVYYLHAHRILHRDLKPENVLLMEDETVKLCDFGFARAMGEAYYATTIKRTPVYMAPEIAQETFVSYNEKVDIWALGCIIYELFVGDPPFFSPNYVLLGMMIMRDDVSWPNNMPADMRDLINSMLKKNHRERASWPDILAHTWFKGGIKVSAEDLALDSPYTKPDIAAKKRDEHYKKVLIMGCGGKLPEGMDFVDGDDDDETDIVIILEGPEDHKQTQPDGASSSEQMAE